MVNSLRYKDAAPTLARKWSPDTAVEAQQKRKREREDAYVQEFAAEDRPILLVQKKQAYTGAQSDNLFDSLVQKPDFFKLSEPARVIEDVAQAVGSNEPFIKRNTIYHGRSEESLADASDPSTVYKIEGLEFLPEGFIELDPLLFADEFTFESAVHARLFSEQQKRAVANRRKQYEQRHQQKMREVTIFVVNEKKAKIVQYLERWYYNNKRRMNDAELAYVSELFTTDVATMAHLQDVYLKRKAVHNTQQLKEYLASRGLLDGNAVDVPTCLRGYFVKKRDAYAHVESKILKQKDEYSPQFLQKHRHHFKKPRGNDQMLKSTDSMKTIKKSGKKSKADNEKRDAAETVDFAQMHTKFNRVIERSVIDQTRADGEMHDNVSKIDTRPGYDKDATLFYDAEISAILDRIKGTPVLAKTSETKPSLPTETMLLNESIFGHADQMLQNVKAKVLQNAPDKFRTDTADDLSLQNLLDDVSPVKPVARRDTVDDETIVICDRSSKERRQDRPRSVTYNKRNTVEAPATPKRETLDMTKVSLSSKLAAYDVDPAYREYGYAKLANNAEDFAETLMQLQQEGNKNPIRTPNKSKSMGSKPRDDEEANSKQVEVNMAALSTPCPQVRAMHSVVVPELPKRVSIVTRNAAGSSIVAQKLRPTLLLNEYYFTLIKDIVDEKGERTVTATATDERGNVLAQLQLPEDKIGQLYEAFITEALDQFTQERQLTLSIRNERNDSIPLCAIKPSIDAACTDSLLNASIISNNAEVSRMSKARPSEQPALVDYAEIVDADGRRLSCVSQTSVRNGSIRTSKLAPVLLGNEYYYQIVSEVIDAAKRRKTTVRTFNEAGQLLGEKIINSKHVADAYYSQVVDELIGSVGMRSTLQTCNSEGKVILAQVVARRPTQHTVDAHVAGILQEIFAADDSRHIALLQRESKTSESIALAEHKPAQTFDLCAIEARDSVFRERRATNASFASQYYADMTADALTKSPKPSNKRASKQSVRSKAKSQLNNSYVAIHVPAPKPEPEPMTRTAATLLGNMYYTGMVDELLHEDYDAATVLEGGSVYRPTLVANTYYNDLMYELASKRRSSEQRGSHPLVMIEVTERGKSSTVLIKGSVDDVEKQSQRKKTSGSKASINTGKGKSVKQGSLALIEEEAVANVNEKDVEMSQVTAEEVKREDVIESLKEVKPKASVSSEVINKSKPDVAVVTEKKTKQSMAVPKNFTHAKARAYTGPAKLKADKDKPLTADEAVDKIENESADSDERSSKNFSFTEPQAVDQHHNEEHDSKNDEAAYNTFKSEAMGEFLEKARASSLTRQDADALKNKLEDELKNADDDISSDIKRKVSQRLSAGLNDQLMDEFFEYCKTSLPEDFRYKDSIMFVTLFYYFLKKDQLVE